MVFFASAFSWDSAHVGLDARCLVRDSVDWDLSIGSSFFWRFSSLVFPS